MGSLFNGKLDVHYQPILQEQHNSGNTSEVHALHVYRMYKAYDYENEQERKYLRKKCKKNPRVVSLLDEKILPDLPCVETKFESKLCMTYAPCQCMKTTAWWRSFLPCLIVSHRIVLIYMSLLDIINIKFSWSVENKHVQLALLQNSVSPFKVIIIWLVVLQLKWLFDLHPQKALSSFLLRNLLTFHNFCLFHFLLVQLELNVAYFLWTLLIFA